MTVLNDAIEGSTHKEREKAKRVIMKEIAEEAYQQVQ